MTNRNSCGGFYTVVKTETDDGDDDEIVEIKPPIQKSQTSTLSMTLRNRDRSVDDSTSRINVDRRIDPAPIDNDSIINSNSADKPTSNAVCYVPPALHDFYRQSTIYNKNDFTCNLCSRSLKCRSARDMRDHALSHGGAHWSSAFRCLLCPYHSHSRRSVSKHVQTAHLIPDGVQCLPGELMETETISRQDELMALVRDCFGFGLRNFDNNNTTAEQRRREPKFDAAAATTALPVETVGSSRIDPNRRSKSTRLESNTVSGFDNEFENRECDYETKGGPWRDETEGVDEIGSANNEAAFASEGWTVIEDGNESDTAPDYCNDDSQNAETRDLNFQTAVSGFDFQYTGGDEQSKLPPKAPLLEALLRNFQFHPEPIVAEQRQQSHFGNNVVGVRNPVRQSGDDDPRALVERLLNVVAPDVARFLLEEGIRDRVVVVETERIRNEMLVPRIETVTGSADVLSLIGSRMGSKQSNAAPLSTTSKVSYQNAPISQRANRSKTSRLGKLGTFKCNECSALFKRRRYMERHIRARHRLHCYRCTMPNCTFTNARELWYVRRHQSKNHVNDTRFVCRFCHNQFDSADEMTSRHHACCSMAPSKMDSNDVGAAPKQSIGKDRMKAL